MTPKLFLDMDGVLVNFVKGACKAHDLVSPYVPESPFYDDAKGRFDMEKIWGMPAEKFWRALDGPTFWEDLEPMPDAAEIVSLMVDTFGRENICILTAPSRSPFCVPGKRKFISKYFPEFKDQMLFGRAKQFLAYPGAYLVDDKDSNVENFNAGGGVGFLLPRPWNSQWRFSTHAINCLHIWKAASKL